MLPPSLLNCPAHVQTICCLHVIQKAVHTWNTIGRHESSKKKKDAPRKERFRCETELQGVGSHPPTKQQPPRRIEEKIVKKASEVIGHCHKLLKTEARWLQVNQMNEKLGVTDLNLSGEGTE